jgi:glutamate synthase domain-containing protein 2
MYKKKQEKNKGLYITISIFIFLAIVYFCFHIWQTWDKYQQSKKRLEEADQAYQKLKNQYEELEQLKAMESSTTGYEMHVRSKFDFVKEGEQVVVITNSIPEETIEEPTQIQKFFNIFKNLFN